MALSEIEKLERRYAENPSGLTFAPLAEVHRKNGDVTRALELLRPGLELHPDYIPASIVLGRCHLDLGDLPAAEAAFTHVLGLDGENVIALKALADISERQHHFEQAERWLHTLLSVDRSNDDARAQLTRIENARHDAVAAPTPSGGDEAVGEGVGEAPAEVATASAEAPPSTPASTGTVEPTEPSPAWISAPEAPETSEAVPLPLEDLEPTIRIDDELDLTAEDLEVEEPRALEEPVEPLLGLVGREVDIAGPDDPAFRVEQSEDIVLRSAGGQEFQVPDAALELSDRVPAAPTSLFGDEPAPDFGSPDEAPSVSPPRPPVTGETEAMPAAAEAQPDAEPVRASDDLMLEPVASEDAVPIEVAPAEQPEPAVPEPTTEVQPEFLAAAELPQAPPPEPATEPLPEVVATPEPELVVTESMAEVLLQQGHQAEALRVYRELEVRHTGDPRLLRKIADLEQQARAPETEVTPSRRVFTAAETGGQSVGDFFRTLLNARPRAVAAAPAAARPPAPPADSSGAPTRPAADALSLSSVFGEEASPLPPAVPTPGPAGGVSFDEFYGAPTPGAASQKARNPDPKNDDLDQFHAWLQNLKR